jgi:GTP-binding protein HflX
MHQQSKGAETAILVHIAVSAPASQEDLLEFQELAHSAGVKTSDVVTARCRMPTAKYFIGQGKAEDIRDLVQLHHASVILVNHPLSASQERNLEMLCGCRVVDRTGLILDIFASRARTFEGKLQVELAQLQHLSTRLIRGWTHLERQKGGIGLRGPGETQLETDRRLIRSRIKTLEKRLDKVRIQRDQSRQSRRRAQIPTVSLVGYTNAGKSTLFNTLTQANVVVANQLFATLDPTFRRVMLPNGKPIVLADTVGFIRHLPHDLVAAFRATLLETQEADLLLHVIDTHSASLHDHTAQVNTVLSEIGADNVPQLEIYNKIDLVPGAKPHLEYNSEKIPAKIWLSSATGEGIDLLREALAEIFFREE